jgi:hypothetical protein
MRRRRRTIRCAISGARSGGRPGAGEADRDLSADSRYLFYCNGVFIGRGPAKGDINHHFYDVRPDAAPARGRNVLAVIVLDMSRVAHRPALLGPPCSVMTYTGGFVLEGGVADRSGVRAHRPAHRCPVARRGGQGPPLPERKHDLRGLPRLFRAPGPALVPAGWNTPGLTTAVAGGPRALQGRAAREPPRSRQPLRPDPAHDPHARGRRARAVSRCLRGGGGAVSPAWKKLLAPARRSPSAGRETRPRPRHGRADDRVSASLGPPAAPAASSA